MKTFEKLSVTTFSPRMAFAGSWEGREMDLLKSSDLSIHT